MQLMKMSLSTISEKGPPLAVAFVSYFSLFDSDLWFITCLRHIPLKDVLSWDNSSQAEVNCTTATTS